MRHLVTPPTILFFISCHLLLGCSEERTSFVPSNEGCAGHATCGPGQVCIAASCKELCSDEHGCSLNDICIGGLCEDGHCGDGVKVQVEECDLGADNANDGLCLLDCTLNQCGDGFVYVGHEECDDGNLIDGDGCNASCERTTPQTVDESAPAHEPESESSPSADSTCEIGPPESSDTEPEPEGVVPQALLFSTRSPTVKEIALRNNTHLLSGMDSATTIQVLSILIATPLTSTVAIVLRIHPQSKKLNHLVT